MPVFPTYHTAALSRITTAMAVVILLCTAHAVYADDAWELKKNSEGISIYTKKFQTSGVKALKVDFIVNGNPAQLAQVLMDVSLQKAWVYNTVSSTEVKRVSDHELIYHTEKSMPWPVTNRDAVMDMKIDTDPVTGIMTVEVSSVKDMVPVKKDIVRIASAHVIWKVIPINATSMSIAYEAKVDPGGSIPSWVTNMFLAKCPFETFKKLKAILEGKQK